jgi:RNA recognition motif-containing protein
MRLFVGNLAYSTTEDRLRQEFQRFGNVTSVAVVIDRMSGRSRGFGFVEFSTNEEGQAAMNELNGTELDGREIVVTEARARGAGGPGGGGGGGGAASASQWRRRPWRSSWRRRRLSVAAATSAVVATSAAVAASAAVAVVVIVRR